VDHERGDYRDRGAQVNPAVSPLAGGLAASYFRGMQRNYFLAGLSAGFWVVLVGIVVPVRAQDAATLAAIREDYETNHKQLLARVEKMEEAHQAQQKTFARLVEEFHALREEIDKLKSRNDSAATQKALKDLQEKIEEVDRKRLADGELMKKNVALWMKDLQKTVTPRETTPKPPPKVTETPAPTPESKAPAPPENGYAYTTKRGDSLSRIVAELRAQGYKTTQKQVIEANPGLNWDRLPIGKTVFIPAPNP
jgi:hypothetical protein